MTNPDTQPMPAEVNGTVLSSKTTSANGSITNDLYPQVKMQAEYYFSDANLVKDKFIQKQLAADETKEGWLPLSLIAGFPRMKKLTRDVSVIREALKDSQTLVVNATGESVKRIVPFIFPEDSELKDQRKVYVSHVPKDATQESLMDIFSSYGEVKRIDLPVDSRGDIRGMAFVEYNSAEEAQKTLECFPQRQEKEMTTIAFKVYKAEQIEKKKEKMKEKKEKKKEKERERREKEEKDRLTDQSDLDSTDDERIIQSQAGKEENRKSLEGLKGKEINREKSANPSRDRSSSLKGSQKANAPNTKEKRWSIEGGEPTRSLEREKGQLSIGKRLKHRSQPLPSELNSSRPRPSFLPPSGNLAPPNFLPVRQPLGPQEGKGFGRGKPV